MMDGLHIVSLQHQNYSNKHNHIKVFPLGQTAVDTRVTHDLVGGFIVLLLDTHFPECIGVWTALFDPLGLGILVGPGRRNDSRGICQEPKRKTSVRWCI